MGIARQVQHRVRREAQEVKVELQQLRSDNQKLKRENARLRRELQKRIPAEYADFAEDTPPPLQIDKPVLKNLCTNCPSSEMRKIVTPNKTLFICPECKCRRVE